MRGYGSAMQICQTPFQHTEFTNYGQPCGFNAPIPNQINVYPDIIGEGNVVSVIATDGSPQLLFFPSLQWPQRRSCPQNPYVDNLNYPYINNLGAWFIRNIFNPIQPLFPQPFQDLQRSWSGLQCARATNVSPPELPLKFHNDTCTSTTDIHYFVTKQFNWFRRPTGCAGVQAECLVASAATACEVDLCRPCNCAPAKPCNCAVKEQEENKKQNIPCMCIKTKKSNISNYSKMSVDSTRSKRGRSKSKSRKPKRRSKNSSHKCKRGTSGSGECTQSTSKSSSSRMSIDTTRSNRSRSKKSRKKSHKCECKEPCSDKYVTTYTDQGIGCAPDEGRETQTPCTNSVPPIVKVSKAACNSMCHQAETWSPKPCTSKYSKSQYTPHRHEKSSSYTSDTE